MEGGHTVDSGGDTVDGIARKFHPDEPWPPSNERINAIYDAEYYKPLQIDDIADPHIAFQVFAFGVNAGVGRCRQRLYQLYGNQALQNERAADCINRISADDTDGFLARLVENFVDFYWDISGAKQFNTGSLKGWIHRLCRGINLAE